METFCNLLTHIQVIGFESLYDTVLMCKQAVAQKFG